MLHLIPRPEPAQHIPTTVIHCPRCAYRAVALSEGRAIRELGAHIIAVHGALVEAPAGEQPMERCRW